MRLNFGTRGMSSQRKLHPDLLGAERFRWWILPSLSAQVTALLGLHYDRSFHRDPAFLLLLALGPMVWLSMIWLFAFQPLSWHALWSLIFLSVALWQPVFEELLFRGIAQGQLLQTMRGGKTWIGLSLANLLTSLLFTVAHLAGHSISWSLLVFVPSLCFGFVRDRFGSVYPSIALHVFYNTGYFLLTEGVTLLNSR
jgi:CAAX protease family protein